MAEQIVSSLLVPSQSSNKIFSIATKNPKKRKLTASGSARKSRNKSKKLTLREVFTYEQQHSRDTLDLQKAIYSISYLMEHFSDIGNEDPDGRLIEGLSVALRKIGRDVEKLFVSDDILRLGGDPRA